jgi:hypothetical protein
MPPKSFSSENERPPNTDTQRTNHGNASDADESGDSDGDGGDESDGDAAGDNMDLQSKPWPEHVMTFFKDIKQEINTALDMRGQGRSATFHGEMPRKYCHLIMPSEDPEAYFPGQLLKREHFSYPHIRVWLPEGVHKRYYPSARPPCKWHGCFGCVRIRGWVKNPRHCFADNRIHALMGKRYECRVRKKMNNKPYGFRGYDRDVLSKSQDYIKMLWRKVGYDVSHRAAISWNVLERLQSDMIQSLSVNGFRESFYEAAKRYHLRQSIQWRSYVDSLGTHLESTPYLNLFNASPQQQIAMQQYFHDYSSKEYGQTIPSISYLISRVMLLMESEADYWNKKMQFVDGKHLSGDHSFKLTKCVLSGRKSKPFTAMYTLMNEFGQVVAWWFTTGTGMNELEAAFQKLKQRYQLFGFDGPFSFTTDRCCHERTFLGRTLGLDSTISDSDEESVNGEDTEDVEIYEAVTLPNAPKVATTSAVTSDFVGEICRYFIEHRMEMQVLSIDTEYHRGQYKAKCLQVTLPDDTTYIFHLASICRNSQELPRCLKMLLENEAIKKVGNRVHNDVKSLLGWNVHVRGVIELGHVANDRSLCGKAPALDFLVGLLWPGVVLEGKDGTGPRVGDWDNLTADKINYAAKDSYATMAVYKRLLQIVEPKRQQKLRNADIIEGLEVTVYSRDWKKRIAEAVLVGSSSPSFLNRHVRLRLDLGAKEKIYTPGTFIKVVDDGTNQIRQEAISSLCLESEGTVDFLWPQYFCLRTADLAEPDDRFQIATEQKQRRVETLQTMDDDNYDADDDMNEERGGDESSIGENDGRPRLPRNLRRRLLRFRVSNISIALVI